MAATVVRALDLPGSLQQIEEIFWETSSRTQFSSPDEKAQFLAKYLGIYLEKFADLAFVAVEGERVLGYILGVTDTLAATEILAASPHLEIFEDMYERYPAHLHINFRAEARGMGLGSELMNAFEAHLKSVDTAGLHLITSATARNVSFYLKNGFTHRVERLWDGRPLLLLGKRLHV